MLACHLHKLQQVLVMLLGGMAVDIYIAINGNHARETVCYLVHAHMKDVLGHLQAKQNVQEPVPATEC